MPKILQQRIFSENKVKKDIILIYVSSLILFKLTIFKFLVLKGGLPRNKPANKDFILENTVAKKKGNELIDI